MVLLRCKIEYQRESHKMQSFKDSHFSFVVWKSTFSSLPILYCSYNYFNKTFLAAYIFDEFARIQVCNKIPALQSYLDICVLKRPW